MVEEQVTITFAEFKAWLVGMIRGKGGALPDLEDWKQIKQMMDKVVPEKETVIRTEYQQQYQQQWHHDLYPRPVRQPWEIPNPNPNWPQPYIGDPIPGQVPPYYSDSNGKMTIDPNTVTGEAPMRIEDLSYSVDLSSDAYSYNAGENILDIIDTWINENGSKKES